MTTTEPSPDTSGPPRPSRAGRSGLSVRVRITLTVALLTAIGLGLAGLSVYLIESRRIDDRANDASQQELDEFAAFLDPQRGDVRATLGATLKAFLVRSVPDDDEVLLGFVGESAVSGFGQGAEALSQDPAFLARATPLVSSGGTITFDTPQGPLLLASQPAAVGTQRGALVVVIRLAEDRAALRETMRTYTIVSLLGLLLVTGVAFVQSGRLLAPLRTLRQTAEEITETDLSRRIPLSGNDDVTALTRTVNGMLDRLEAAFAGQRQLLDDAGHELRTPLTVLQGHLELLDTGNADDVAETRELLLDEVSRMGGLVEDLILLAKSDRPGFLHPGPVDVAGLTATVLAKAAGLGERDWSHDGDAAIPPGVTVLGDEQRITQALLQLAANAVRHTGPDEVVAIGASVDDGHLLWWVRDTGPGVPEPDRERIFQRFGRGTEAAAANPDGFGLGLSIVSAIAQAHGGDAWLDDAYTDGARFVLSVPLSGPPTSSDPSTTPPEAP